MKALIFQQTGVAENVLSLQEAPAPQPGPGEVLIRVKASPVNPSDHFFIRGTYRFKPVFPQIAGLEGAGIVEAVGEGVSVPPGSLVCFDVRGAWAEYVVAPESAVVMLPADFPLEKAAQFYLNPFTAWCLLDAAAVSPGDWLCVTAASAAVSKIVLQLAQSRGVHVIATVHNSRAKATLAGLRPDAVLDQDTVDFAQKILEITGGAGLNAALDAVGGKTGTQLLDCMAVNAKMIVYGLLSPDAVTYHNPRLIYKNLTISGFGIRGALASQTPSTRQAMIGALIAEISKPGFILPVAGSFSFRQFGEALKADAEGGRKGKIIFKT